MSQQLTRVQQLESELNSDFVQKILASTIKENSSSFAASLIEVYSTDSYLQECDPRGVIREALKAASLKLPISRGLGYAYIIPYKGKASFQLGYKGFIQLAIRSGLYETINADIVYEGELTSTDKLRGTFEINGTRKSDKVIGYFAHIRLKNGFSKTLYMTVEKINAHAKKYSATFGKDFSPWKTDFDAMALKTVLKNVLSHYGSLSVEMQDAFTSDIDEEIAENANKTPITFNTDGITDAEIVAENTTPPANEPEKPNEPKFPF